MTTFVEKRSRLMNDKTCAKGEKWRLGRILAEEH